MTTGPWRRMRACVAALVEVTAQVFRLRILLSRIDLKTLLRADRSQAAAVTLRDAPLRLVMGYTRLLCRLCWPRRGRCLPVALTLNRVLPRMGLPVGLCCGVRRTGDGLMGHAWLTLHGRPFGEPGHRVRFTPVVSSPEPASAPAISVPPDFAIVKQRAAGTVRGFSPPPPLARRGQPDMP